MEYSDLSDSNEREVFQVCLSVTLWIGSASDAFFSARSVGYGSYACRCVDMIKPYKFEIVLILTRNI